MKILKNLIPQRLKNKYHYIKSKYYHLKYNKPSTKLKILGVTGTDGKTTTCNLIFEILKEAKKEVGIISTLNAKYKDKEYPVGFHVTTPDSKLLQKFLNDMVNEGIDYVVLESTSHGLDQYRLGNIQYETAAFTNITNEHLDYHKTYNNYLLAKSKLITQSKEKARVILNKDDKSYKQLREITLKQNKKIITYSIKKEAEYFATDIIEDSNKSRYTLNIKKDNNINQYKLELNIPGVYNISNSLCAIATCVENGIDVKYCISALKKIPQLEGRWEILQEKPFKVIIDFAHTPNALENVLIKAETQKQKGRLIIVFGSAGLRDKYKRPMMGEYASKLADIVIITAEDPRTEDVNEINNQIELGIKKNKKMILNKTYYKINDRKKAIKKALSIAKTNDIVLITGKGHEKSMNLDGIKEIPWSDQDIVKEILNNE